MTLVNSAMARCNRSMLLRDPDGTFVSLFAPATVEPSSASTTSEAINKRIASAQADGDNHAVSVLTEV
jgi:hypothetical protein